MFGESFEDVDGIIDLVEKVVCIEEPIAILAHLEDNPGFPCECEELKMHKMQCEMRKKRGTHLSPSHSCPQSGVRKSDTINVWPLLLAFGFNLLNVWLHPTSH